MRKNGFTLVELLAVLSILAIITSITTITIINTIKTSKEKAFENSSKMLLVAANNYFQESNLANTVATVPLLVTFSQGKANSQTRNINGNCENDIDKKLEYSGKNPYSGNVLITETGDIKMKVYDNISKKCLVKDIGDKTTSFENISEVNCILTEKAC